MRKSRGAQWLFLLPGGEGQDEGERHDYLFAVRVVLEEFAQEEVR